MQNKGVIYILTNPSFPQYVKIGYATESEAFPTLTYIL